MVRVVSEVTMSFGRHSRCLGALETQYERTVAFIRRSEDYEIWILWQAREVPTQSLYVAPPVEDYESKSALYHLYVTTIVPRMRKWTRSGLVVAKVACMNAHCFQKIEGTEVCG
jgi:hypothetical protein